MTLRHLKIFVEVCRQKSVTRAAEALYLSQPAVSLAIRELEEAYGVVLFDRISRRLSITDAGRKFYGYAAHITGLFSELGDAMKDWETSGRLRVGSSITIGTQLMPQLVKRFQAEFPEMEVFVTIDSSDEMERRLLQGEVDIALIEGEIQSGDLTSRPFFEDELAVVCGKCHPLAKKGQVSLQDLRDQKFLMREKNSGTRRLADSILLFHGITPEPVWESASTQAIVNAVAEGLGVSILPLRLIGSYRNSGRLRRLQVQGLEFKRQFRMIWHRNKYLTSAAKAFLKMCQESPAWDTETPSVPAADEKEGRASKTQCS